MRNLMERIEYAKGRKYDAQVSKIEKSLKSAMNDIKEAADNADSADSVVFNVSVAIASLATAISAVSKGHGGKLSQIVGQINGAASDLSTKGRSIVKGQ